MHKFPFVLRAAPDSRIHHFVDGRKVYPFLGLTRGFYILRVAPLATLFLPPIKSPTTRLHLTLIFHQSRMAASPPPDSHPADVVVTPYFNPRKHEDGYVNIVDGKTVPFPPNFAHKRALYSPHGKWAWTGGRVILSNDTGTRLGCKSTPPPPPPLASVLMPHCLLSHSRARGHRQSQGGLHRR